MRRVPRGLVRTLIALLALAAIGTVIVVWTGGSRAPASALPAAAPADVRQPAAARSPANASDPANAADAMPVAKSKPDAQRQAVESPESEIANVRVVLASTGEPVAGARVRYRRPQADLSESDVAKLLLEEYAGGEAADREALLQRAHLPVDPIECKAGDRDVEIRLRAAGEVTATFLVDDSTPVDRLVFRLCQGSPQPVDERELDCMNRYGGSPNDGRLPRWWRGLVPGTYDLEAVCAGVAEPLASVAGMIVGTGPCTDPRLDGIDLRGRLRKFEIRVTDADGQPIADENAFVIACSHSEWSGYALGNGTARVYATTSLDMVVTAPGCRAARFHGVTGSRTVALERAVPSAFRVALPLPLPDGVTATLRLVPKADLPHDDRFTLDHGSGMPIAKFFEQFARSAPVGRDGVCAVPVVWPGEHTVDVSLATGERLVRLTDVAPRTVVLPAPAEIVLAVDRSGYDAALQRMRQ